MPHPVASLVPIARSVLLSLTLVAGLSGCRHKTPYVLPQVSQITMDLEVAPDLDPPLMIDAPETEAAVPPPLTLPPPPKRVVRKRAPAVKDTPPPVQVASAAEPAAVAIGELSSGGDSTPQSQQATKDLIADIRKRLSVLPGKVASQQKDQVRQVRYFLKQAQQALESGDAEGAKNLATKAKLLMDDVEKK